MRRFRCIGVLAIVALAIAGCRTSDGLRRDYLESMRPLLDAPSRPVIIIPGFGVSRLYDPDRETWVWGTPRTTVITTYEDDLDLPLDDETESEDNLEPRGFVGSRGPINTAWQIANALQKYGGYRVARWTEDENEIPTAYLFEHDWRLSAFDNAERLDDLIEQIREEHGDPELEVDLVTHSAGANVALAYLHGEMRGLVEPTGAPQARWTGENKVHALVMIAPPRRGTLEAFKLLVRGEQIVRRRFDPVMASSWPAVFEFLPHDPVVLVDENGEESLVDLHELEAWRSLGVGLFDLETAEAVRESEGQDGWERRIAEFERSLDESGALRQVLTAPIRTETKVVTVVGDCVPTVQRLLRRSDGTFVFYRDELEKPERRLIPKLFGPGDGTIEAASAEPIDDEEVVRLCSGHQGLAQDPAAQRAILRMLLEDQAPAHPDLP